MVEVMIKRRNVIFDSQILSAWMACKRLTDFQHHMNLVPMTGKGHYLEMGLIVHVALAEYYRSVRDGIKRAEAIQRAIAEAKKYTVGDESDQKKYPGVKNTSIDEIDNIFTCLNQYWLHYSNEYWTPIDVEKVKEEIIYQDEDIRVKWKVKYDLTVDTNQGIYPVDHKTYRQRRDTLNLNNQFSGQCVVAKTNAVIINKFGLQTSIPPKDKFLRPMVSYSTDRLKEWVQLVGFYAKEYADYVENGSGFYPPNYTHCDKFSGCIYRDVCMADRNMRETELRMNFVVGEPWEPTDD